MNVLKFFLWPILLFSLLWIAAIFFGPSLISTATSYFSEGQIRLTRVKVSPKLKISASVIELVSPSAPNDKTSVILTRGVSIDWRLKGGFGIIGQLGPSLLQNGITLSSATFRLEPYSILDWSGVGLELDFKQLEGATFEVDRGEFTGNLVNRLHDLQDFELDAPTVRGELFGTAFEASDLNIKIDQQKLFYPFRKQNSNVVYSLQKLNVPQLSSESSKIEGTFKVLNGDATLDISATDFQFGPQQIRAKSVKGFFEKSLSAGASGESLKFSVSGIEHKAMDTQIENYSGNLSVSPAGFSHTGRAVISKLELKTDQYFIGQIDSGNFDIVLKGNTFPSRMDIFGQGILTLEETPDFSFVISVETAVLAADILNCFKQGCPFGELEADYRMSASGSSLTGNAKCEHADCLNLNTHHVLQTDNTNKFFQAVANMGIFSPLALPLAYMAVSNGEVAGDGHILNF